MINTFQVCWLRTSPFYLHPTQLVFSLLAITKLALLILVMHICVIGLVVLPLVQIVNASVFLSMLSKNDGTNNLNHPVLSLK